MHLNWNGFSKAPTLNTNFFSRLYKSLNLNICLVFRGYTQMNFRKLGFKIWKTFQTSLEKLQKLDNLKDFPAVLKCNQESSINLKMFCAKTFSNQFKFNVVKYIIKLKILKFLDVASKILCWLQNNKNFIFFKIFLQNVLKKLQISFFF